eukprot:g20209.t1
MLVPTLQQVEAPQNCLPAPEILEAGDSFARVAGDEEVQVFPPHALLMELLELADHDVVALSAGEHREAQFAAGNQVVLEQLWSRTTTASCACSRTLEPQAQAFVVRDLRDLVDQEYVVQERCKTDKEKSRR